MCGPRKSSAVSRGSRQAVSEASVVKCFVRSTYYDESNDNFVNAHFNFNDYLTYLHQNNIAPQHHDELLVYAGLAFESGRLFQPIGLNTVGSTQRELITLFADPPSRRQCLNKRKSHKSDLYGRLIGIREKSERNGQASVMEACKSVQRETKGKEDVWPSLTVPYVSIPSLGITNGIALDFASDELVPGKSWSFKHARNKRAIRLYMMCARTGHPRDDPEIQQLIQQEPLTEQQLNLLLAKVREVRASMQRVEQECGLDPTGIELDPDRAAI